MIGYLVVSSLSMRLELKQSLDMSFYWARIESKVQKVEDYRVDE